MVINVPAPAHNAPAYSASEVARWMRLSSRRVQRWASGYVNASGSVKDALVKRAHDDGISFLELVELRYARQFFERGFSHDQIAGALHQARAYTGHAHPFAYKKVYWTGSDLFIHLKNSEGDVGRMFSLLHPGQIGIDPVVLDPANELDWDASEYAERWWPRGKGVPIVIDPQVQFGAPVLAGTRIATGMLADMHRAGDSITELALSYKLEEQQIRQAIAFEERVPRQAA